MTAATHQHGCAEVDHLNDEVRDLRQSLTVYANEHMRMAAIVIAARAAVAALRLPGNNPDVDADLATRQSLERLMAAVDDAQEPAVHPDAIAERIRQAIGDPGSILPRLLDGDGAPDETVPQWASRAVLHVLTHGVKAGA